MSDVKYEIEATLTSNGMLKPLHYDVYKRLFAKQFEGKPLLLTVQILRKKRSDRQNRYYYGVVIPTIQAFHLESTGEYIERDEVHAFNLTNVLGVVPEFKTVFGEEIMIFRQKKSSEMNTKEFAQFVDTLIAHWAEKGCIIPEPKNENLLTDFLGVKDE
jgi:hypothetical protein